MLFMPLPYISTNIQGQPSNWVKMAPSTLESALGVWRKTYGFGWQASSLDTLSNIDLAGTDHSSHCRTYSSCCWQSTTLLSQPHLLFLLPAETTPLQANGVGVVCYATLLLSPCWTARNFMWRIWETLIVCDPVQSSQIVHGKSTLSQPFSITNLVVIGHTMIFQVRHLAKL